LRTRPSRVRRVMTGTSQERARLQGAVVESAGGRGAPHRNVAARRPKKQMHCATRGHHNPFLTSSKIFANQVCVARVRKRPVQLALPLRTWGGWRKGAGRKPKGGR